MTATTRKILRLELGLYTLADIARLLCIRYSQLQEAVKAGTVAKPIHKMPGGTRPYYNKKDLKVIREYFKTRTDRLPANLLTMRAASKALSVNYDWLCRMVRKGKLPAPSHRVRLRKCYKVEDLANLQVAMNMMERKRCRNIYRQLEDEGYYSGKAASRALAMPYITFQSWILKGWFPKPARIVTHGLFPLYDTEDIETLRRIRSERLKNRAAVHLP